VGHGFESEPTQVSNAAIRPLQVRTRCPREVLSGLMILLVELQTLAPIYTITNVRAVSRINPSASHTTNKLLIFPFLFYLAYHKQIVDFSFLVLP